MSSRQPLAASERESLWFAVLHARAGDDLGSRRNLPAARTHRALGLAPAADGLTAWEAPGLVLVTAPRWLDIEYDAPANVVHAGPLSVAVGAGRRVGAESTRHRVVLTFSTTDRPCGRA